MHGFPDKLHCPKGQQVYEVGGVCQTKPHVCNVSGPNPNCCSTAQTGVSNAYCLPHNPPPPNCNVSNVKGTNCCYRFHEMRVFYHFPYSITGFINKRIGKKNGSSNNNGNGSKG